MSSRRPATRFLDALPLAAGWLAVAATFWPGSDAIGWAIAAAALMPPIVGIWAIVRIRSQLRSLAEPHWRASLKLTLLPAEDYLESRLRARLRFLLAALWTAYPALLAAGSIRVIPAFAGPRGLTHLDSGSLLALSALLLLFLASFVGEAVSAGAVAVLAALRILRRLCQADAGEFADGALVAGHILLLLLGPIFFFVIATALSLLLSVLGMFAIPFAAWGTAKWFIRRARAERIAAIAAYYELEAPPR